MFTCPMRLADGTPADPPTFTSSEPNWRVGDRVIVGAEVRYRIVAIDHDEVTWTVQPVHTGH
jgi:hypothetical protein